MDANTPTEERKEMFDLRKLLILGGEGVQGVFEYLFNES